MLTQEVELVVLYDTEEGLASARQKVVVQHRLSGQSGGKAVFSTELLREPTAAPAGEGVEVSFPLAFRWMVLEKEEAPVIGRVTLGEKRELGARQPSVILRAVHPGEDLWSRGQGLPDHGQRHYGGQRPDLWGDFPGPDAADPPEEQLKGAPRHTVPGALVWRFMMDTGGREADSCGFYRHSRWSVLPAGDRRPWAVPEW